VDWQMMEMVGAAITFALTALTKILGTKNDTRSLLYQ
jgi:hypothetical protein